MEAGLLISAEEEGLAEKYNKHVSLVPKLGEGAYLLDFLLFMRPKAILLCYCILV